MAEKLMNEHSNIKQIGVNFTGNKISGQANFADPWENFFQLQE